MKTQYSNFVLVLFLALFGCGKSDVTGSKHHSDSGSFTSITGKGKLTSREKDAVARMEKQFSDIGVFPDIKKIIARGMLNIGVGDVDCPPFVLRKPDGELGGLDISIAGGLAKEIGVKPKFICVKDRSELLKKLHSGDVDIAIGELSNTFDRAKYVYFSSTYATLNQSLIFCNHELLELDIEDNPYDNLKNKRINIGVLANSSHVEYAQSLFPEANLVEYPAKQDILEALDKHEIMAMVEDSNDVAILASRHPEIALSMSIYILKNKKDNIAMAVSPTCPNLLPCINLYLEAHDLYLDLNDLINEFPEIYRCE